jgi:hypothetical protein
MKHSLALVFASTLVSFSPLATASEVTGNITYLEVRDSDGLIYTVIAGARSAKPACAQSTYYFMIKDENSGTGKRTYAMLLAAKLAGKAITVYGTGTCTRWPDGEDISGVNLSN